jgi:acyl carrier protein
MGNREQSNRERIVAIVKNISKKATAPDAEESLFDSGFLDSFALPDMVSELEREFGIKIPDSDLNPRKFESIARIETYLENKK